MLVVALLFSLLSQAGTGYEAALIPDILKKNANVVKRLEEVRFEVMSLTETVYTRKYALTILNEEGRDYAQLVLFYDKLQKVRHIEGALYNAGGVEIKRMKAKDVRDESAVNGISLYDDNRIKRHDFDYHSYPYTVEYEVEIGFSNTYIFPRWIPQNFSRLSVEKSSYTLITPEFYQVRYKSFLIPGEPAFSKVKDKKIQTWQVANLAAFEQPFASPVWHEITPSIFFAPSEFEMQGYKSNATSWEEFGKFSKQLNANRDLLPANIIQQVHQLTDGVFDTKEKVKRLYEYMQQNTRYISIQLGIGGLQPFEASYVAQKGYGDCKALSNYLYSMLKAIGIKSHYTLIRGGSSIDDRYMMDDFPSDQFNHIVLCVPMTKDTLWLECTSQTDPAGYMGSFTGNRKALAITEEGGKLVSTPSYSLNENLQVRKIDAVLNNEGNLTAQIASVYKAQQQDELSGMLQSLSKDEVKKMLNQSLDLATYNITDFHYETIKDILPYVKERLTIEVPSYASISGKRLFITPNLMTRSGRKNIDAESRSVDFVFNMAYRDIDTVLIQIPVGFRVESMPEKVALSTPFGSYSAEVKVESERLIYYRKMEQFSGRYPTKAAFEIAKFFSDIFKADRSRVVLVKLQDN